METEIDFLKLEKSIKKALIKNYCKLPENRVIPEISILLDELGIMSHQSNLKSPFFWETTLLLVSSILISEYLKQKKRMIDHDMSIIIQETLRNTKTYKTCLETYNLYLDKYVELLDILGIKDSDEVSIFYQFMLDNGLLSYHKTYHYDKEKITKKLHQYIGLYELDELSACKISTGIGVCRHSSSQLTDIQNRVGNPSCNFYVEGLTNSFNIKKYKLKTINHQYTITKDTDNKYYGYCTTSQSFIKLDFKFKDKYIHASTFSTNKEENSYETIIPLDFNLLIPNNNEIIKELLSQKETIYRIMDEVSLGNKYKKIKDLVINNSDLLEEFYHNTKEDLKIISDCYKEIVPSNGKIKNLIIR